MADVTIKFKYKEVSNHRLFFIGGQRPNDYDDYALGNDEITDNAFDVDVSNDILTIQFLADCDSGGNFEIEEVYIDGEKLILNPDDCWCDEFDNLLDYSHNFIL